MYILFLWIRNGLGVIDFLSPRNYLCFIVITTAAAEVHVIVGLHRLITAVAAEGAVMTDPDLEAILLVSNINFYCIDSFTQSTRFHK